MARHRQQHETPDLAAGVSDTVVKVTTAMQQIMRENSAALDSIYPKPGSPDWYRVAYPEEIAAYRQAEAQRQTRGGK